MELVILDPGAIYALAVAGVKFAAVLAFAFVLWNVRG